ncbi:hypothetical protein [Leuconostoc mesenteroides]|uniref:hypothetical protein n=1 Tax=Leuconostoc mesenteroides TaxID=1245 RepID=UPI0023627CFB|nr:hypothetical protein [Leuconostoc mesenteroides]
MTEPVAYWHVANKNKKENYLEFGISDNKNFTSIPLYTKEQLHPRVKMTKAEFEEFKQLYSENYFKRAFFVLEKIEKGEFGGLYGKFGVFIKDLPIFANLWVNYEPEHPEESIEIVPDMKWFVRSKEQYQPDMDQGISESGYLYLTQGNIYSIEYYETTPFKDDAQQFDTKEEAEIWTNPLTEAVKLPAEEE